MTTYASLFQLVLDFGNSTCYGGSGNAVTNLGTSGATNDYFRGLSNVDATRAPTFNGTPGALDRTCFFSAAANGKIFTPQGTPDILTTAHQAGGQFTIIIGGHLPASLASNNYEIATCLGEGAGQGPGVVLRIGSSLTPTLRIAGDAGSTVFSRNFDAALSANSYFVIACGIQDGNNKSWMYTNTFSNPNNAAPSLYGKYSDVFNPTFASPSVSAAQSIAYIWQNGATGTIRSTIGMELMFMLVSNSFMTPQVSLPLTRTFDRRNEQNLP